jgi:hypothetical protein
MVIIQLFGSVRPEMVACGSGHGRSDFATTSAVRLRGGWRSARAGMGRQMPFVDGRFKQESGVG